MTQIMVEQNIIEFLKKVPLLENLPDLESLADACEEVSLKPEEMLFREDDLGDAMYIIVTGCLKVFKKHKIITSRFAGEHIGEMALLGSKYRSASIKALTDTKLIKINDKNFHKYLTSNHATLMAFLKTMSTRSKEDLDTLNSDFEQLVDQRKRLKRLKRILDDASNDFFVIDSENYEVLDINLKAAQNTGYSLETVESLKLYDLFPEVNKEEFLEKIKPLKSGTQILISFEAQIERQDKTSYPAEVRLQFLDMEEPPLLLAVLHDVSERKATERQIKQIALIDSLTGLPNRNLLKDRFDMMHTHASRRDNILALLYMDLDNFKNLNDSLGHQGGDELLKEVAHRLKSRLRKEDSLGRLGRDEFIVMLSNSSHEDEAAKLAQNIAKIMEPPFYVKGVELYCSFSIGISLCPTDGKDMKTILKNADIAMHRAKERGGNTYEFFIAKGH
mgnify:FL=1